jgi:hypothetical protein
VSVDYIAGTLLYGCQMDLLRNRTNPRIQRSNEAAFRRLMNLRRINGGDFVGKREDLSEQEGSCSADVLDIAAYILTAFAMLHVAAYSQVGPARCG